MPVYPWRKAAGPDTSKWVWHFDQYAIRRLERAVVNAAETVPPDASLFALARKAVSITQNRDGGDFEEVARSWADFWEWMHPGRESIDRSEMLANLDAYLKRIRSEENPLTKAITETASPPTWPDVPGESNRLRRLLAICQRLATISGGQFFVPTRDTGDGIGCSHTYTGRLLRRLVALGFITRTGELTTAECPYYILGPCFPYSPETSCPALRKPSTLSGY
jgi:hypothetical protein